MWHACKELGDGGGNVRPDVLVRPLLAGGVSRTSKIESHRGNVGRSHLASEKNELPVTADAILWSTDDDQHAEVLRRIRDRDDTQQTLVAAFEQEWLFAKGHCAVSRRRESVTSISSAPSEICCASPNLPPF